MAVSTYDQPYPSATDRFNAQLSKAAVLIGQWLAGDIVPPSSSSGMNIPENDEQVFSYYGATNNVFNIVYKKAGAVVATQTFEYVGGAVADDDDISRITVH